tara:strand:+ start:5005 stop:6342 length:1338 start_codon:yes stop_codon:yes gene_type:complete
MSEEKSEVKILSAVLGSTRTKLTVDITSILVEVSIFENIENPFITGYITVVDNERLIEKMDIQGAETLRLRYVRNTNITDARQISHDFIVQSVDKQIKTNDMSHVVALRVIDKEAFKSSLCNVNSSYRGEPYEIINKIMVEYLDRTDLQTSALDNVSSAMQVIIPNLTPLQSMQWITRRSTTPNGFPYFMFKTAMTNEYILTDLESLISSPVINENNPFSDNQSGGSSNSDAREFVIYSRTIPPQDDLQFLIREGVIGSTNKYYDVAEGDFDVVEFNVNNDLIVDLVEMNKRQKRPTIDGELGYGDQPISNYSSKTNSHLSSAHAFNFTNSYDEANGVGGNRNKIKSFASKHLLNKNPFTMVVDGVNFIHGNQHFGVGNNIKVLTKAKTDDPEPRIDIKNSGDYLITAVNYVIKIDQANKITANVACTKVANYTTDRYVPVGGGR